MKFACLLFANACIKQFSYVLLKVSLEIKNRSIALKNNRKYTSELYFPKNH